MTPLRIQTAMALSALAMVPMAVVVVFTPAISSACLPGETAGATACAPFCLPGKALDVQTGLCAGARSGSQRSQPADQQLLSPQASEITADVLSLKTSVTVLHQNIGDSSDGLGGDASASKLRWWLLMNLSILAFGDLAVAR